MEEKLAAYRARKQKEITSKSSSRPWSPTDIVTRRITGSGEDTHSDSPVVHVAASAGTGKKSNASPSSSSPPASSLTRSSTADMSDSVHVKDTCENAHHKDMKEQSVVSHSSFLHLTIKVIMWCALFGLFVCAGFGAVFIILSLFYFIYINLRTGKKAAGEKSAYSVFNPECERIHGTLTAEEIERGMLYGVGGALR